MFSVCYCCRISTNNAVLRLIHSTWVYPKKNYYMHFIHQTLELYIYIYMIYCISHTDDYQDGGKLIVFRLYSMCAAILVFSVDNVSSTTTIHTGKTNMTASMQHDQLNTNHTPWMTTKHIKLFIENLWKIVKWITWLMRTHKPISDSSVEHFVSIFWTSPFCSNINVIYILIPSNFRPTFTSDFF